jgi:hypothetical protein
MKTFVSLLLPVFLAVSVLSYPAPVAAERTSTQGCGGAHFFRQSGNEISTTFYRFRNFNSDRTLTITEITIFATDGTVLATLSPGSFPAGFDHVLGPNQTTGFDTEDIFGNSPSGAPPAPGLLQAIVKWEGGGNALYGITVRIDRARDAGTGAIGLTRGRDHNDCLVLK